MAKRRLLLIQSQLSVAKARSVSHGSVLHLTLTRLLSLSFAHSKVSIVFLSLGSLYLPLPSRRTLTSWLSAGLYRPASADNNIAGWPLLASGNVAGGFSVVILTPEATAGFSSLSKDEVLGKVTNGGFWSACSAALPDRMLLH